MNSLKYNGRGGRKGGREKGGKPQEGKKGKMDIAQQPAIRAFLSFHFSYYY